MKIFTRLNTFFDSRKEIGTFFLRLVIGWRLIDGTQDNVFSWERMMEFRNFLEAHSVPFPLFSAQLSVYAQFICGILYMLGAFIRPAAIVMIVNFIAAICIVHLGHSFQDSFAAWMMLFGSICILYSGAGTPSIDNYLLTRRKF
jgi:putative oxidoreductase